MNVIRRLITSKARQLSVLLGISLLTSVTGVYAELAQTPLIQPSTLDTPPFNMIIMGRDHTLYYEAYNDASDLNGDGVLDVGYKPDGIDYFGYFDSYLCYSYSDGRFSPSSKTETKKCSSGWSGDFLNYITTTRMDALRKVLYGGRRIVDEAYDPENPNAVTTILERSYIPQDAHSWGKEYYSIEHDNYDIRDYTPLSLPSEDTRHLFANTTLRTTGNKEPLMRVLTNSQYRIWDWVAIERPVAGSGCTSDHVACEVAGGEQWLTVPEKNLTLTQTTYRKTGNSPTNETQFDILQAGYANDTYLCGSQNVGKIDGSENPFNGNNSCTNDNYLTIFQGTINVPEDGNYTFSIDGDDAIDLKIDDTMVASWYGGHGKCNCNTHSGTIYLTQGNHTLRFRHEEKTGGDNYYLRWRKIVAASEMTDYFVRVQVCKSAELLDSSCTPYTHADTGDVTYKPTGLLQSYGEDDQMLFGLITGSYGKNTSGGVLRKNIESFRNEIDPNTGVLTNTLGIVRTIDRFRIAKFNDTYTGGWVTTRAMNAGEFQDWGNPIAEMMYESLRYFSGESGPTTAFLPSINNSIENVGLRDYSGASSIDLPVVEWQDPYTREDLYDAGGNAPPLQCSPGAQLVISDVNPSFDSDQIPGTSFGTFDSFGNLNVTSEANAIWSNEHGGGSSLHFIGQVGSDYDGAPSAKEVSGLGNIRGLSPSEPTKQGSYYSAAIARYAYRNDLREGDGFSEFQNINTFSVALASPLPRIEIPVGDSLASDDDGNPVMIGSNLVTVVPFAKSVGGSSINASSGQFQPTNSIVDFFVEEFANTDPDGSDEKLDVNNGLPYIKFRINFEDVEQGADHDMDAIAVYELKVVENPSTKKLELQVDMVSEYAAGGIMQHMGYVISGTTKDGVYLEVRDMDTSESSDPDYFLDTMGNSDLEPGDCALTPLLTDCQPPMPLQASRTFLPKTDADADVATVLENPLWYAAKYGSKFSSTDNPSLDRFNITPGRDNPSPNYFLVTNAANLQEQLETAFQSIMELSNKSGASPAANDREINAGTLLYKTTFDPEDWSGEITATYAQTGVKIDQTASEGIPACADRNIFTWQQDRDTKVGIPFEWDELTAAQKIQLTNSTTVALDEEVALLNWIRGCEDHVVAPDSEEDGFRDRTSLLGDIVNSNPLYVANPDNKRYQYLLPVGTAGKEDYGTWLTSQAARTPVLYVGANDGMLHAFDAKTLEEKFAYIPTMIFDRLDEIAEKSYATGETSHHLFLVDGSPTIGEAFIDGAWKSVLIGTLGAGGKGIFALDVTDPDNFDETKVLWEFTSSDLGYQVNQMPANPTAPPPVIGRLQNGDWAVVFGNGYESGTGAWLFIVNLATGELIKKIQASNDITNGLSGASVILDSTNTIVAAYAGDMKGNVWKFDLTSTSPDDWALTCFDDDTGTSPCSVCSSEPIFTAAYLEDGADVDEQTAQPITSPLEHVEHPSLDGYMLYFGTGSYMYSGDPTSIDVQSVYGIWDNSKLVRAVPEGGSSITTHYARCGTPIRDADSGIDRIALREQTIIAEGTFPEFMGETPEETDRTEWRLTSNEPLDYQVYRGWFLDLISTKYGEEGERVIARPQIAPYTNKVTFATLVPKASTNPCQTDGAESWFFALDFLTGGRGNEDTFDANEDGVIDENDLIYFKYENGEIVYLDPDSEEFDENDPDIITAPLSGYKTGYTATPLLMDNPNSGYTEISESNDEERQKLKKAAQSRQGWRQLR